MKVDDRLGAIERELADLRAQLHPTRSLRVVKLKGLLKGLRIDTRDLDEAKKSLFKHASS